MKEILLVEDDEHKSSKIKQIITETIGIQNITLHNNVCHTVRHLDKKTPDILILDMSLPSHPPTAGEGSPLSMPSGGIEVVYELYYLKKVRIPTLILTQYTDVEIENEYYSMKEAEEKIRDNYGFSTVKVEMYDNDSSEWKDATREFLLSL